MSQALEWCQECGCQLVPDSILSFSATIGDKPSLNLWDVACNNSPSGSRKYPFVHQKLIGS